MSRRGESTSKARRGESVSKARRGESASKARRAISIAAVEVAAVAVAAAAVAAVLLLVGCGPSDQPTSADQEPQGFETVTDFAWSEADMATRFASTPSFVWSEGDMAAHLGFVGDICLDDTYTPMETLYAKGSTDISDGIDERYLEKMRGVDVMWVNNEFCFTDGGEPLYGKMYTFSAPTANVKYLQDMGADIAGLANNHTYDFGEQAFVDTLNTLRDAGILYVGAGMNYEEASEPLYVEVKGLKIAYVAASCAEFTIYTLEADENTPGIMWCYDDDKFLDEIREAAANADYVVALPHWGNEHTTILTDKQTDSARAYIDAGADIVIGTHSHILQGIDYYDGKPILYNLGNFWFDGYDIDTVLAELIVSRDESGDANCEVVLYPGTQSGAVTSWAPDEEERDRIFRYIEEISDWNISIDDEGRVHPAE